MDRLTRQPSFVTQLPTTCQTKRFPLSMSSDEPRRASDQSGTGHVVSALCNGLVPKMSSGCLE